MKALKYAILGMAAARLTQLVVDDEITEPIRDRIQRLSVKGAEAGTGPLGSNLLIAHPFWDKVDTAVNCHACSSVWAGGGVLAAEQAGPVGRFLVRTLALSQAALAVKAVIERIDRG